MVSRSVSLPSKGFFSPFPHGTGSLSVSVEYLALPDGPGGFTLDSSCPALLRIPLGRLGLRVRSSHALRPAVPGSSPRLRRPTTRSYNPATASTATVWATPLSLAATRGITFVLFSCGYLDVSVPRVRPRTNVRVAGLQPAGLPHSETRGSKAACASPRNIAACRVLHRLTEPRYPPSALSCFLLPVRAIRRVRLVLSLVSSKLVKDLIYSGG